MTDTIRHIALVCIVVSLPLASALADTSVALIEDIHPGSGSSYPGWVTDVDGVLFFTADDGVAGHELWKSDGTPDGTVLVKDIIPGPDDSWPSSLTNVAGTLFFNVDDDIRGYELWKSDGTEAGTVIVRDIIPGSISSTPRHLIEFNGMLFFEARVYSGGRQLMKSDGTEAGTVQVTDAYYTPEFSANSNPYMTKVNNSLFFVAEKSDGWTGYELWKTDGTSSGTVMVKDINPGPFDSDPSRLFNVDGTLFFGADDGSTGKELWLSDGTEAGTRMVKEIRSGFLPSIGMSPSFKTTRAFKDKLFFIADDGVNGEELWRSDGTEEGTVLVKDLWPGPDESNLYTMVVVGETLFFVADDGVNGYQLWKTDGTTDGTTLVMVVSAANPSGLTEFDGMLFFQAGSAATGAELWLSDGTAGGTVLVYDIYPGPSGAYPWPHFGFRGALLFTADDGNTGYELWMVDCPQEFGVCGDPFTVNSIADVTDLTLDGFCDTGNMIGGEHECTLRAAIQESNATPDPQKIDFEIPQSQAVGGVFIIEPASSLPIITDPAVFDATTQQGYQTGAPVVELKGKGPGGVNPLKGFRVTAGSSIIRGFSIYGFGYNGILIQTEGGNLIESNIIGTNAQSVSNMGNGESGILVLNSSGNTIGGPLLSARNVISGNGQSGTGGCGITVTTSANNRIFGNRIGTDVAGMASRANIRSGVFLNNAGSNFVGGSGFNEGNVISGNGHHGIYIAGG